MCSVECFIAQSHIYPGFTDIVSTLPHLPLEPVYENYSFWDQAVADSECGLDSILTDSVNTLELDVSFDEEDTMQSSVPSGFLHLLSTISDNCRLQLITSFKSHKLWWQASVLLIPVLQEGSMSASMFICYFCQSSSSIWILGFFATRYITLNTANKKSD